MGNETNETNEKPATQRQWPGEDAWLRYLADRHPDDEASLETMSRLMGAEGDEGELLDVIYKGLHAEENVRKAEEAAYLKGRNENIEMRRLEQAGREPTDDGGRPEQESDLLFLSHLRQSVWD